ncbi:MAG: hypothetical protein K8S54_06795 [Spirochaetia bacterium]|nr:hypothetical protein [Spirochaetia bacterium]
MLRKIILLLVCTFVTTPVFADKVRLNLGLWPGQLDPELEPRFFKDDLLTGANFGRLNLEWVDKDTYTIFPLGAQYMKDGVGPGTLILAGNYSRYQPDYKFNGVTNNPALAVSIVSLDQFKVSDWELEAGYQLPVIDKTLFVTPKFGARWHFQEFNYNELTLGNATISKSLDSPFKADAKGTYVGAGLQYYVTPQVSLLADYVTTAPGLGHVSGSMTDKRTVVGVAANTPFLRLDNATAGYTVDINRWMIGAQYDVTADLHVMAGVRQETTQSKYKGYFNIPIVLVAGTNAINAVVEELITDKLFWESKEKQTKGFIFMGVSYDINL